MSDASLVHFWIASIFTLTCRLLSFARRRHGSGEFAASGEFVWIVDALWGAMPGDYDRTDRFLNHVFPSALNRFPSSAEQTSEHSRFDTAGASGYDATVSSGKDLGRWLFLGSEYAARGRTDHWFVYDLYQTFLRYDPDAGGWSYWEQQVAIQGRPAILEAFMATSTYQQQAGSLYREVFWLTTDHLGTPRMIAERTGILAGVKRHDYLPFGEELGSIGGRGLPQGYVGDTVRKKFTGHERDGETTLDYMQARYCQSLQGRFISADSVSGSPISPQTLNLYAYVANNPLRYNDPTGRMLSDIGVFQTGDPWQAQQLEHQSLRDLQISANSDYAARNNGTVAYSGNTAAFLPAWPAGGHDAIIAAALAELASYFLTAAQLGSRQVDAIDGIIPITLAPGQAYKHAMVPEKWVQDFGLEKAIEMAQEAATNFTNGMIAKAKEAFTAADKYAQPGKGNYLAWRNQVAAAFYYFGQAIHPIMDAESPAHKGWQVYGLTGNLSIDILVAVKHSRMENRSPTKAEMSVMRYDIRFQFTRAFGGFLGIGP